MYRETNEKVMQKKEKETVTTTAPVEEITGRKVGSASAHCVHLPINMAHNNVHVLTQPFTNTMLSPHPAQNYYDKVTCKWRSQFYCNKFWYSRTDLVFFSV